MSRILLVLGLLAGTEAAEAWAQVRTTPPGSSAGPILLGVSVTQDRYVLTGRGFGTKASVVQVFEGTVLVPASAIAVVEDDRIVVLRRLSGTVQHKVVVGGLPSGVRVVTHPPATTACGPHGSVDASGACNCNTGFTGPNCSQCAANFYGPACRYCLAASTCKGNGLCTASGQCKCAQGFTGPDCGTPVPLRLSLGILWPSIPGSSYWAAGPGSAGAPNPHPAAKP